MKKEMILPKGFLTKKGKPTQNALMMYFVYLTNLPSDWKHTQGVNEDSLNKVRNYFGVDYGFRCMINWGVTKGCAKSKTSSGRFFALSLAYHDALGMVGQGYRHSLISIL